MAVPIVFIPVRNAVHRYTYVGAPYVAMWGQETKAAGAIRVTSIERVRLPSATGTFGGGEWIVIIAQNALATGPRAVAFTPPDKPARIQPGARIALGSYYNAWFDR